ncbi:MAG: hypothetical protein ACI4RK_09265 [Oscillospiraceae bacterium]
MNSIKPFQPAKGLVPTVRNISTLNDDLPNVSPVFRDDELTYKQDSGMTGELLLTLLEAMKQFRVQSGGSITVSNNTTVIRNNICSIVNNFRNAVSGRGSVSLDLLMKNISDTFSSEAPSARSAELLIERLTEQINALGITAGRHSASAAELRAAAGSAQRAVEQALKKNADLTGELSYFGGIPGEVQLRKLYPQPSVHNGDTNGAENSLSGTFRSILHRENPLTYPRQAPAQGRSAGAGTPEENRVPGNSAAVRNITRSAPGDTNSDNSPREPHESRAANAPNADTFTRSADVTLLSRRDFWYPKTAGFPAVNGAWTDHADRIDRTDQADSAAVYRYLVHRSEPADGQNSVSGSPGALPPAELIQLNSYLTELRQPLLRETLRYAEVSGEVLRGSAADAENSGNAEIPANAGNSANSANPRTSESGEKLMFNEGAVKLPGRSDYAYFANYTNFAEPTARQPRGSHETHAAVTPGNPAAGGFRETELFYLQKPQDMTSAGNPERSAGSGDSHNAEHSEHAEHAGHTKYAKYADSAVYVPHRSPSPAPRGAEVTRYLAEIRRELIVSAAAQSQRAAEVSQAAETSASQRPALASTASLGHNRLLRALLPGAAADSERSDEAALHAAELIVLNRYADSDSAGNAAVPGAMTETAPVRKPSAEAFDLLEPHPGAALRPSKAALMYGSLSGQPGNTTSGTVELLRTLIYTENRATEPFFGSTAAAEPHSVTPAQPARTRPGYAAGTTAAGELIYAENSAQNAAHESNSANTANADNLPNSFSGAAITPPQIEGKTYLPAGAVILPGAARSLLIRQIFGRSAAGNAGHNGTAGLPGRDGIPGAEGASFSAIESERLPSAAQRSSPGGAGFTEAELLHISRTIPEGAPAGTARSAAAALVLTQGKPDGNAGISNITPASGAVNAHSASMLNTTGTPGAAAEPQGSTLVLRELREISQREELRRIILRDSTGMSVSAAAIAAFNEPNAPHAVKSTKSAADRYLTVPADSPGQETRTIEHFVGWNNYLQQIDRLYQSERITAGQRGIPGVTTNEDKNAPRGEISAYPANAAEAAHNSHDANNPNNPGTLVYGVLAGNTGRERSFPTAHRHGDSRDHRSERGNSSRRGGLEYFTSLVRGDLTLKNSFTEYFTTAEGGSAGDSGKTAQGRTDSPESALLYAESGGGTIENGGLVLAAKPQNSPQERSDSPRAESSPADNPQPLPPAEEIYKQLNINSDISRLLSSEEALKNYVRNQINSYFSEQHSRSGDNITQNSYHSTEMICEQVITRLEHRLKTERRLNGR